MNKSNKTSAQLVKDLEKSKKRIAELEKFKTERKQAKKELQEKQKELDIIFDSVPAMIWSKNIEGKYLQVNRAYCKAVGLSREKILGRTDYDLYPTDIADLYFKYDQEINNSGKPVSGIEERHLKPSGDYGWSLTEKMSRCDAEGNVVGTIGFAIDITERKQMEQEIKESEEKYKTLYETTYDAIFVADSVNENIYSQMFRYSPFPIIIHDMEMNIIDANNKAVEEFDYPKEELLKKKVTDLHTVTELEHSSQVLENMQKVDRMTVETSFMRKDGSVFNAEATPSKYKLGDKLLIHVLIQDITERKQAEEELLKHRENLEDLVSERTAELKIAMIKLEEEITNRKQAEEALRASRDYLEKLTNSMWDAVFSIKMPERVIEWANDSFRHIGYEPRECIGKDTAFLYADKDDFLDFGNKLKDAMTEGKDVLHAEHFLKRKSGENFPAEITITFHRENDEVVSVTSIVRDITERKLAEEVLKKKMNELEIFNDAAVDRELMVNDLRKEINELLKKLGKEPKYNIVGRKLGFPDESG